MEELNEPRFGKLLRCIPDKGKFYFSLRVFFKPKLSNRHHIRSALISTIFTEKILYRKWDLNSVLWNTDPNSTSLSHGG